MGPHLRSLMRESGLRNPHKVSKTSSSTQIMKLYTYEAVKAALCKQPIGNPALNRVPTRQCRSMEEKTGRYRHHNWYETPKDMEELDYIRTINVCSDESLQEYLKTLGNGGVLYLIRTTTYWENMRELDIEKRKNLKLLWEEDGKKKTFQKFLKSHLRKQNQLWMELGVNRSLNSNLSERQYELRKKLEDLKRERIELEEKIRVEEIRGRKRMKIIKSVSYGTSETEDETDTEGDN